MFQKEKADIFEKKKKKHKLREFIISKHVLQGMLKEPLQAEEK